MAATDLQVSERFTVLSVFGELDLAVEQEVRDAWMEALAGRPPGLLLNLSAVPLLDSSGVRLLLAGCQRTRDRGTPLAVLVSPESHVGRILELVGIARVLPLFQDWETAARSLIPRAAEPRASGFPESTGDRLALGAGEGS